MRRTVRDLRRHNRSVLLSSLYLGEPQSRQDLGRSSGLSQGTVSNVVGELIEEGLVVEAGLVDSDGGRPRTLLRVNPGFGHVVGVDVGETGVQGRAVRPGDAAAGHRRRSAAVGPARPGRGRRADPRRARRGAAARPRCRPSACSASASACPARSSRAARRGARADDRLGGGPAGADAAGRHRAADLHGERGQDARPGRDVVRRRPGCAARGHRAGRLRRRRCGDQPTARSTAASRSSAGEWGHTTIVYGGRAVPVRRARLPGGVRGRGGRAGPVDGGPRRPAGAAASTRRPALAALIADGGPGPSGCWPRPPATSAPASPTWSTCSTRSGSCWAAGPGWRWAGGCWRRSRRPRRAGAAPPVRADVHRAGQLGLDAVALGAATLPIADLLARGAAPRATPGPSRRARVRQ